MSSILEGTDEANGPEDLIEAATEPAGTRSRREPGAGGHGAHCAHGLPRSPILSLARPWLVARHWWARLLAGGDRPFWCSSCRAAMHDLQSVTTAWSGTLAVVGVDISDPHPAAAQRLLAAARATYPVGMDPTARVAAKYEVTDLPVVYLVTAAGRVAGAAFGIRSETALHRWAQRLATGTAGS